VEVKSTWSYTSTSSICLYRVVLKLIEHVDNFALPSLAVCEPARSKIKSGVKITQPFFIESSALREGVHPFTTNNFHNVRYVTTAIRRMSRDGP
jgi:hypothetical protein